MSGQDYDRVIAQENKVLASIQEHCENIIPEFKEIITFYIKDWSIELMKAHWTAKPEIIKNLGPQKSQDMKKEFKEIFNDQKPQISEFDPQIWLHRIEIPQFELTDLSYSYYWEKRSKKYINLAIRELIGLVGALLIKYGFIEVENDYDWKMTSGVFPTTLMISRPEELNITRI